MKEYDIKSIQKELEIDAKALNIPSGAASIFIKRSITAATKSLSKRTIITENDLKKAITKELRQYHPDLAYVYQNRDTII